MQQNDIDLYGLEATNTFASIAIVALPCNSKLSKADVGATEDQISENCNPNLDAQLKYIQPPNFVAIYNQERLNLKKFGDESIERFSTFMNIQFDEKKPSWTGAYFERNELIDETEYLNYG